MSIFGWSLPPGCTHQMIEDQFADCPCDVCGQFPDDCVCPECPVCGDPGNPGCYEQHGLVRSFAQVALRAEAERQWEEEEKQAWSELVEDLENLPSKEFI